MTLFTGAFTDDLETALQNNESLESSVGSSAPGMSMLQRFWTDADAEEHGAANTIAIEGAEWLSRLIKKKWTVPNHSW